MLKAARRPYQDGTTRDGSQFRQQGGAQGAVVTLQFEEVQPYFRFARLE